MTHESAGTPYDWTIDPDHMTPEEAAANNMRWNPVVRRWQQLPGASLEATATRQAPAQAAPQPSASSHDGDVLVFGERKEWYVRGQGAQHLLHALGNLGTVVAQGAPSQPSAESQPHFEATPHVPTAPHTPPTSYAPQSEPTAEHPAQDAPNGTFEEDDLIRGEVLDATEDIDTPTGFMDSAQFRQEDAKAEKRAAKEAKKLLKRKTRLKRWGGTAVAITLAAEGTYAALAGSSSGDYFMGPDNVVHSFNAGVEFVGSTVDKIQTVKGIFG